MSRTRWKFDDPWLLWLFPATYVLHIAEEAMATAPILLWRIRLDRPLDVWWFVTASGAALALMAAGVALVRRGPRFHWIAPAIATAALLNTAGHVVGGAFAAQYSAGLMTAVVFWVPLAVLTLVRAADDASRRTLLAGVCVGIAIETIVAAAMLSRSG